MTRRLKSTCGATGISFLSFSKALCVCVSHNLCSVSLIYCFLSCYKSSNIESSCISKPKQRQRSIRAKADHVTDCVFLPAHTTANERGYTQFVRDLIGSEARRVGSRGGFHCVCFATGKLSFLVVPAPLPPSRSVGRCLRESQMDQMEGMKTGEPLSSFCPNRSSARSLRLEARPAVLPPGERARRTACLLPRRGTGRMSMSFRKA